MIQNFLIAVGVFGCFAGALKYVVFVAVCMRDKDNEVLAAYLNNLNTFTIIFAVSMLYALAVS